MIIQWLQCGMNSNVCCDWTCHCFYCLSTGHGASHPVSERSLPWGLFQTGHSSASLSWTSSVLKLKTNKASGKRFAISQIKSTFGGICDNQFNRVLCKVFVIQKIIQIHSTWEWWIRKFAPIEGYSPQACEWWIVLWGANFLIHHNPNTVFLLYHTDFVLLNCIKILNVLQYIASN